MDSYRLFRTGRQDKQFQIVRSPVAQKAGLAWLSGDLLLGLRKRRKMHGCRKQGQAVWEEFRDAGHHCKDKILVAKA